MRIHPTQHIVLLALLGFLAGCRKDVDLFRPYEPSVDALRQTLAQVPEPSTKTVFTLANLDRDTLLTTASGMRVFLTDPDALFQNGAGATVPCSSCATLRVEVTEVLRKGDILARALPTRSNTRQPLECVLMVQIQVSCDGAELQPLASRYVKIQVPAADPAPGLSLWNGETDGNTLTGWSPASNGNPAVYWAEWLTGNTTITGYEVLAAELGWVAAARLIPDPTTTFCIQLPPGYDGENSQAFVLLNNSKTVLPLEADDSRFGTFCIEGAPIGYPVQIITLSKVGKSYLLGNAQTEIGTNATVPLTPQNSSEAEIIGLLRNL